MRSNWKTTIGVLGIIFGSFGVLSAGQIMLLPMTLDIQRRVFTSVQEKASQQNPPHHFTGPFDELFKSMFGPTPAWFTSWCVCLGLVSLAIGGVYVFSAIWLLLRKPTGARLLCMALCASVAAEITRVVGLVLARGIMGLAFGAGGMFGIVIDLVLLVVVLAHRDEWGQTSGEPPPVVHSVAG